MTKTALPALSKAFTEGFTGSVELWVWLENHTPSLADELPPAQSTSLSEYSVHYAGELLRRGLVNRELLQDLALRGPIVQSIVDNELIPRMNNASALPPLLNLRTSRSQALQGGRFVLRPANLPEVTVVVPAGIENGTIVVGKSTHNKSVPVRVVYTVSLVPPCYRRTAG